jgi:hypothetical protein
MLLAHRVQHSVTAVASNRAVKTQIHKEQQRDIITTAQLFLKRYSRNTKPNSNTQKQSRSTNGIRIPTPDTRHPTPKSNPVSRGSM